LTITGHGHGQIKDIGPQVQSLLTMVGENRHTRQRSHEEPPRHNQLPGLPTGRPPLPPDPEFSYREAFDLGQIRDACLHLARAGMLRSEGDWTRVAQGLAAYAADWPEHAADVYAILDQASLEGAAHG